MEGCEISASQTTAEKLALERRFGDWVKNSKEWWVGDWGYETDLAQWHFRQYLRARKPPAGSLSHWFLNSQILIITLLKADTRPADTSDGLLIGPGGKGEGSSVCGSNTYYDPIRDMGHEEK